MLQTMLGGMKQIALSGLKERTSFRALWYKEWAELFLKAFEPGQKVVYTSIYAFPMEILAAFDVVPFDFEIAGSLLSITDMGLPLMVEAEERGYSRDVCSFHRASLGGYGRSWFPKPDLLTTTSFYCDGKAKTNDILARLSGADSFLLSVPHEISRESVMYVEKQLRSAAVKLAETAGTSLDEDRLKEVVRSSNRSRRLHLQIIESLKKQPVTLGPQDLIGYSIIGRLFSGRPAKEMLDSRLLYDIESKLASGKARPEKHRIFWFGWTPTYQSNLYEILKEHAVSVAMCETYRMYWDEIDEDNPFEGLAVKCLKNSFLGPTARRTEGMDRLVAEHGINGALLFATPACRQSKSAHMLLKNTFSKIGVPFLMLDMDISDPRGYMPEQTRTRLESFVEVMESTC